MKRTHLKRTPLKRGKSRMRRVSKTNSRPWENLPLREEYRREYPACEVFPVFQAAGLVGSGTVKPATDIHHIFHLGERTDAWPNIIALCRKVHAMDGSGNAVELRVACLWVKWMKSRSDPRDWDLSVLNTAAGAVRTSAQPVQQWLETHPSGNVFIEGLRVELLSGMRE